MHYVYWVGLGWIGLDWVGLDWVIDFRSTFDSCSVRRALCPGRVRSRHHPLSRRPFLFLLLFLEHPWGHWTQKCGPWWLPGGSLVAPWWIPVMGRDFLYTQKTSGFTLRFAFGWRANGPRPPTYPPHPPTYGFMAQFFTTCIIFSSFFEKMLPALGGDHIFEHQPIRFCIKNTTFPTPIRKEKE